MSPRDDSLAGAGVSCRQAVNVCCTKTPQHAFAECARTLSASSYPCRTIYPHQSRVRVFQRTWDRHPALLASSSSYACHPRPPFCRKRWGLFLYRTAHSVCLDGGPVHWAAMILPSVKLLFTSHGP